VRHRSTTRIGLIADTHGLLRPEALAALRGCQLIVHAGDIGGRDVLETLESIAPVTAVRGNNDTQPWAAALAPSALIRIDDVLLYAVHDLADLDIDPRARGIRVVVSGHSHKPHIEERDEVLFVNPGSAGPRRFRLPIALALLVIDGNTLRARRVDLADGVAPRTPRRSTRPARERAIGRF
jgi:putative phosphoesterase